MRCLDGRGSGWLREREHVLEDTVDQSLAYLFPNTLDEFRELEDYVPPEFDEKDAVSVLNLARLTGATPLLPVLVLICCRCLSGSDLVDGVWHCDGSHDALSSTDSASMSRAGSAGRTLTASHAGSLLHHCGSASARSRAMLKCAAWCRRDASRGTANGVQSV